MSKPGFTKLSKSDTPLYGPRALVLCGFGAAAQSKFSTLLSTLGLSDIPLIWVSEEQQEQKLSDLFHQNDGFGAGQVSSLPRAVLVAGIKEKELHRLMTGCRKTGMKQALWATLTPTSSKWSLKQLLAELHAERKVLSKKGPAARHG